MANTSQFAFTNVTAATTAITPIALFGATDGTNSYGKTVDEPTVVVRSNTTCPLDQGELLTTRYNDLAKVSTSQSIQNPLPIKDGCQYVIKLEEILRTTNAAGDIVGDEPVIAYLTIRHQKSGNITSSIVDSVVKRLLGACYASTDGTPYWNDYMRSFLTVPQI